MSLCILTNTAALFPTTAAASGRLIHVVPLEVDLIGLSLPDVEAYSRLYSQLEQQHNAILVLAASESILPGGQAARLAAQSHGGTAHISVLDTRQIGPGLGILAQLAARKAATGASLLETEDYLRSLLPYLFTIICPDFTPVAAGQQISRFTGQSAEQVGALSVFTLEDGVLAHYKKVRTQRHLHENLQEFIGEFERPQRLAYFHGRNAGLHTRPLREAAGSFFPGIQFSDLEFNDTLNTLFGEHTVGMTVLEVPGEIRI